MPETYDRCVRKVAAKGKVKNPHAVCTAVNAGNVKKARKRKSSKGNGKGRGTY